MHSSVSASEAETIMNFFMGGGVIKSHEAAIAEAQKLRDKERQAEEARQMALAAQAQAEIDKIKESVVKSKSSDTAEEGEEESDANKKPIRRGLTIVKKGREPEKQAPKVTNEPQLSSASKPQASALSKEEQEALRKKKAKKVLPAVPKKDGVKIDLFKDRPMNDFYESVEEEPVVMLPDFSVFERDTKDDELLEQKKAANKKNVKRPAGNTGGGLASIARTRRKKRRYDNSSAKVEDVTEVEIPENVRVYEFAEKVNKTLGEVIKVLFNLGMMVTKNDFLDKDAIEILADEFGVEVYTKNEGDEFDYLSDLYEDDDSVSEERPPIVTIMGHVDHGKTSLLDKIRNAKVAAGEAGGITQHIGAYMVEEKGRKITFIDTPGHEAFTQMRARGAQITDIAIIVVAADDGVMPQTVEAINHAKAAEVPFIIAVNKMDKAQANPDYVKTQMAEIGITPVEWGGEHEFIHVSAHTGAGIDDLLDTILIQADLLELSANPENQAKAVIVESALEKGRGPVSTAIVKDGTLRQGDNVVVGPNYGRVRAIINEHGKTISELRPGQPGQILGLDGVTTPGDILIAVDNDKVAREYAEKRREYMRQRELSRSTKASFDDLHDLVTEGMLKRLNVILKTDYQGTLEAIRASIEKLRNDEVKVNVVHSAVGEITESDVDLATATDNTIIFGFNVKAGSSVKEKAKHSGIEIRSYSVLYDMIEEIKHILGGILSPVTKDVAIGKAEVREIFTIPKIGVIAGCMVIDGVVTRDAKARIVRREEVVYEGEVESLKRFKDDVKEVKKGFDCGISLKEFVDMVPGDTIEFFKTVFEKAKFSH